MFSYTQWALDWLSKAAGHKYIKRVPYQSGGRMRYRYIYNVTHTHQGKHVLDPEHMTVGTKLMLDATSGAEVHGHIQSVSGDKVTFIYDDGPKKGESVTMSKEKLASELDKVHGISGKLDAARKKQSDVVAKLKESGASAKQIARAEARLKALGGDTPKAETPKAKPKKAKPTEAETSKEKKLTKKEADRLAVAQYLLNDDEKYASRRDSTFLYTEYRYKNREQFEADLQKIIDAPDTYLTSLSVKTEKQTLPFTGRRGEVEQKEQSVVKIDGLLSEYAVVVEDDTAKLVYVKQDSDKAGLYVVQFPAKMLENNETVERLRALPSLEGNILTLRDAAMAISNEANIYHLASMLGSSDMPKRKKMSGGQMKEYIQKELNKAKRADVGDDKKTPVTTSVEVLSEDKETLKLKVSFDFLEKGEKREATLTIDKEEGVPMIDLLGKDSDRRDQLFSEAAKRMLSRIETDLYGKLINGDFILD